MLLPIRTLTKLDRLFVKPGKYLFSRCITGAALKEEVNYELVRKFNKDIKEGGVVPVFRRALLFPKRIAIHDEVGIYTYGGLYEAALTLSKSISSELLGETECTVAYMCGNEAAHVIAQWAIWMSGNIAVPLSAQHPAAALAHLLRDAGARLALSTPELAPLVRGVAADLAVPLVVLGKENEITAQLFAAAGDSPGDSSELPNSWYGEKDAMLIYTSGTTSQPKGVVWSHGMLQAQTAALHAAWRCAARDVALHALPLHHIHGQLNSLHATLAAGGRVRMLRAFSPHAVWSRLLGMGEPEEQRCTVLHGVPAQYAALAAALPALCPAPAARRYARAALARLRLMCAGSAPLPDALAARWYEISGHRLLERYGMSEAGMALSGPYRPAEGRAPGRVGAPLPGVGAAVARADGAGLRVMVTVETPACEQQICLHRLGLAPAEAPDCLVEPGDFSWQAPVVTELEPPVDGGWEGELLLRGPGVFTRYWNRAPELNSKDFTPDGWFRTGDTARFADNQFSILGRTSVDIIKASGYKVSALQVEAAILDHDDVTDAAVLGVPHPDHGETVAALVVVKPGARVSLHDLRLVAGKKLAPYQLPRSLLVVDEMPRNAMGKLDKRLIRQMYEKQLVVVKE